MKKWRCNVCGYVHEGDEPPDTCPVCGADKSAFELVEDKDASSQETDKPKTEEKNTSKTENQENTQDDADSKGFNSFKEKADKVILDHHLHPISVHIPNGVIPIAVFLLLIGSLFDNQSLINAAYYNITLVFLFMPVVLYTGYVEWTSRYKKAMTGVFKTKIASAGVVAFLSALITLWKSFSPDASGLFFLTLHIIMLAAAGIAGHLGGKFVFKN